MVALFQKAFPTETDVHLRFKAFPDCGVWPIIEPKVEITADYPTDKEIADWYASLTYLFPCRDPKVGVDAPSGNGGRARPASQLNLEVTLNSGAKISAIV